MLGAVGPWVLAALLGMAVLVLAPGQPWEWIGVVAAAVAVAWRVGTSPSPGPHAVAAAWLATGWLHPCADRCADAAASTLASGIPTAVVGAVAHGIVALLWLLPAAGAWAGRCSLLLVGATSYFALRLAVDGTWCLSCVAVHGLMAAQAVAHARRSGVSVGWQAGWRGAFLVLAGAAGAMAAHLVAPVRPETVTLAPIAAPGPGAVPAPRAGRERPERIGRPDAPWTLEVAFDPMCEACADQMEEVLALLPETAAGRLTIRLLPVSRSSEGDMAAGAIIAAGFGSEADLLAAATAWFRRGEQISTHADPLLAFPAAVRARLLENRAAVEAVLTEARRVRAGRSASTTPVSWLLRGDDAVPVRTFAGLTAAGAVRRAMAGSVRPAEPGRPSP